MLSHPMNALFLTITRPCPLSGECPTITSLINDYPPFTCVIIFRYEIVICEGACIWPPTPLLRAKVNQDDCPV